jgi:tRNA dimethylallyltransferase
MRTIIICGATATGKSDLAVALAKEIGAEIVNADSMQVYEGMDIGTAKLPVSERGEIPHHLLDVLSLLGIKKQRVQPLMKSISEVKM